MSCFASLFGKKSAKDLPEAATALGQGKAADIASNFNDKQLVLKLFSSAENGRLTKDQLEAQLKKTNLDKADVVGKKIDEVTSSI